MTGGVGMKKLSTLLLSMFMLIGLVGCGITYKYPDLSKNLTRITDSTVLKAILLQNSPNRGWYETMKGNMAGVAEDSSNTNTQVTGIDEGDTVKTNGEFIVNILNNKVYVIDVATNKVVKVFSYEAAENDKEYRWASEIYLTDTQLIIMGTISTYGGIGIYRDIAVDRFWGYWGGQDTFIEVVNLDSMAVTKAYDLKGGYFSSRLKDDELIIIANQWQTIVYDEKNNPTVIEPTVTDVKDGTVTSSIDEGNAYVLPNNQGNSFVNILKIDLTATAEPNLSSYLGWIQTVYMNEENLIIAQSRYEYNETTQLGSSYTDLMRFDVETLDLKAKGSLKGYLLNQFSMDIYQGTL